jgi:hypothetical protein
MGRTDMASVYRCEEKDRKRGSWVSTRERRELV